MEKVVPWKALLELIEPFYPKTSSKGGLLVITESQLLATPEPSPRLRLHGYFRAAGLGFPESP